MTDISRSKLSKTGKKENRIPKVFRRILTFLFGIVIFICAVVLFYSVYAKTHYKISFYQLTSRKVSGNVRIALIADIHNREYGENNEKLISDLSALKPDLILFVGDMVIREQDDYQAALDLVSASSLIAPSYGVLGNHESERIYYRDDKKLPSAFEDTGLHILRNAMEEIEIGKDVFQLIGVEGTSYGFEEYGGREFMDQTKIDPSSFSIVMSHIPVLFEPQLSEYDFDLGVAGHVHGGIVVLPFIGGLYSAEEGFFPRFTAGKYTLSRQQDLIISRGLGDSRAFPPRINNTPELVVIDISRY